LTSGETALTIANRDALHPGRSTRIDRSRERFEMARWETTNWSLVLRAGADDSATAREAVAGLCEAYWYPVYAMVRRYGHGATDAEDLTQAYFTRFLEKGWVKDVRPEHGRFRAFLLVSVRNFLHNERDRERALKRGGGQRCLELDGVSAERRYALEPTDRSTPETLFERAWAESVLERALQRLRAEMSEGDEVEKFDQLKGHLTGDEPAAAYRDLAEEWGVGEPAVRVRVHRLRRRFGRVLRDEIAATVADPAEVGEELRHLLSAVGR
jgi:RNA polymerase sigma-70 factor (ECF subfamily)